MNVIHYIRNNAKVSVNYGAVRAYILDIPLEFAKHIVENRHPKQRKISAKTATVRRLVRELDTGDWDEYASDPMHFDSDGYCTQGQHRCQALLNSTAKRIPNQMVYVFRDRERAMKTASKLDQTSRIRNLGDSAIIGDVQDVFSSADEVEKALIGAIYFRCCHFDTQAYREATTFQRADFVRDEWIANKKELYKSLLRIYRAIAKRSKGLLAAIVYCMEENPKGTFAFFSAALNNDQIIDGEISVQAKFLYDYIVNRANNGSAETEREDVFRAIRYFNAWLVGEELKAHAPYIPFDTVGRGQTPIPVPIKQSRESLKKLSAKERANMIRKAAHYGRAKADRK